MVMFMSENTFKSSKSSLISDELFNALLLEQDSYISIINAEGDSFAKLVIDFIRKHCPVLYSHFLHNINNNVLLFKTIEEKEKAFEHEFKWFFSHTYSQIKLSEGNFNISIIPVDFDDLKQHTHSVFVSDFHKDSNEFYGIDLELWNLPEKQDLSCIKLNDFLALESFNFLNSFVLKFSCEYSDYYEDFTWIDDLDVFILNHPLHVDYDSIKKDHFLNKDDEQTVLNYLLEINQSDKIKHPFILFKKELSILNEFIHSYI